MRDSDMLRSFNDFLVQHSIGGTYYLAYSGGLDSTVLLALSAASIAAERCKVVHVHHGISTNADAWVEHCRAVCARFNLELIVLKIAALPPPGESLEAYARQQRYHHLAKFIGPADILLTAHHQDDQGETLLLQLLRGSGLRGLSAMPIVKTLGQGQHGRPLLNLTRAQLETYAHQHGLQWIDDDLNQDMRYPRNYVRHHIMPLLRTIWPAATSTLARAAKHCAEAQALLDEVGAHDLRHCYGPMQTLSLNALVALPWLRQKLVLRLWLHERQVNMPSEIECQQILTAIVNARPDRQARLTLGKMQVWRYRDHLYLLPACLPSVPKDGYHWDASTPLIIPKLGVLSANINVGGITAVAPKQLRVLFWYPGSKYLLRNGQQQLLAKIWQAQRVPPWLRPLIPIIYIGDEVAAIPGYLVVSKFAVGPEELGYHFHFDPYRHNGQNSLYYSQLAC